MRILKLTRRTEKWLLARRAQRDDEAHSVAAEIVADVRRRGDSALFAWTKKLDDSDLSRSGVWISRKEIRSAEAQVGPDFLKAIRRATKNVRRVAEQQLPRPWTIETEPGVKINQRVSSIESIGCYIPGGLFSLVSTLVMTAVPAQVAGVPRIIAVCPRPNTELLATANLLGIEKIARVGGAQAIAALAYGTNSVPRVEKIFGPGNKYVTAAKQLVSGDCAIDLPAGPTETIVLAAEGNARWIAGDLLAQAEHAKDAASFFVTTSRALAQEVQREIKWQLAELLPGMAGVSTEAAGAILVADSLEEACEFINRLAPEHLSLPENGERLLQKIRSAGTVFLGPWGAQPLGDYATGSNHVLPTGGWARKRGGLSAADFVKCMSVQTIRRNGFLRLADTVETLAESEGLMAHRNAVRVRR
ncbi:MAG TPA: histidinol dehydrogenase [Candidatus Polarisedimenticolia bacterium]|nr:histidinol dehydrogenase [Candidatus Polarisedimenticolia bacterium]